MVAKTQDKPKVDRKRSLAAKKAAITRAHNRELATKRALRFRHKIVAGGTILAVIVFTFFGIRSQLEAYAATTSTGSFVGLSGKCLDNSGAHLKLKNKVQLYKCNGTLAQKWVLTSTGALKANAGSNYCLDVPANSKAEYAYVQLYTCNDTGAQKFKVVNNTIVSSTTGYCVTVRYSETANNTRIWMKSCHANNGQKWLYSGQTTTPTSPVTPSIQTTPAAPTTNSGGSMGGSTGGSNSGTSTNNVSGNIAILPDFYDSTWLSWNDGSDKFPMTWQGYTDVLQIAPNPQFIVSQRASGWTGENEINGMVCNNGAITGCARSARGTRVSVRPGQKVTYSAYVWVTPSTVGAPSGGGFQFFMDVYGANGRIKELQGTNACDGCGRLNVPFGSNGWTFVQMQFTMPSSFKADGALGYGNGSTATPTGVIPILQLNNWAMPSGYNEKATAYIRNTILTVQ